MTELEIINSMFRLESQAALNDVDDDHPMVPTAKAIIRESLLSLLTQGWWFNTFWLTLEPLKDGTVPVADNVLEIREVANNPCTKLARVGNVLQDLSGEPIKAPLKVRAIIALPLTQLPHVAADVVRCASRLTYAQDIIKDPTEADVAMRQYNLATTQLRKEAIRQTQFLADVNNLSWSMQRQYRRNRANRRIY